MTNPHLQIQHRHGKGFSKHPPPRSRGFLADRHPIPELGNLPDPPFLFFDRLKTPP